MLFVANTVKTEELNSVSNLFVEIENEFASVVTVEEEIFEETPVSRYITSLVSSQYQRSIEEIENTNVSNKRTRKRTLQQVMRESFFAGANRFGNNFIA
jgi:hypothetical protein